MTAIWYRARADLRARWRAIVALMVLVGLAGAVSMAAFAGSRRTVSAYSRFLAASDADDVSSNTGAPGVGFDYHYDPKVAVSFPEVSRARIDAIFFVAGRADDGQVIPPGDYALQAGPTTTQHDRVDVPKLVSGSLPDPGRADEIAVAFPLASQFGLHAGSKLVLSLFSPVLIQNFNFANTAPFVAKIQATVTGIVAVPGGFPPLQLFWSIYGTPAFYTTYKPIAANVDTIHVLLRHGHLDLSTYKRHMDALAGGAEQFQTQDSQTGPIERPMRLYSSLLWLFGMIAAVSSAFAISQLVARQALDSDEAATARALGMTTGDLIAVALVRAVVVGLGAIAIAIAVAIGMSPIFPIGNARFSEPAAGIRVDGLAVGLGSLAILSVVLVSTAIGVWLAARRRERISPSGQAHPSFLSTQLASMGAPLSLVAGLRMALERGRGRTAIPVRSAITASIAGVVALCTALVMTASVQHFVHTPRLFGIGWDIEGGNPYGHDLSDLASKVLNHAPEVAAYSSGTVLVVVGLHGQAGHSTSVNVTALDLTKGVVTPPMAEGHWPANLHEIALGSTTMHELNTRIGGTVSAHVGERSILMRVVGRAVFPQATDQNSGNGFGNGAGMTFQALRRLVPNAQENVFPIDYTPGVDRSRLPSDLSGLALFPFNRYFSPPSDLADLAHTRSAPFATALVLALLAAATSAHLLLTAIRRRRRDLAVLRTLGFLRRQIQSSIAWQATSLATVALVFGIPLGIVLGRTTWSIYANSLGIVPEPVIPGVLLVFVAAGALLLANLVALLSSRAAVHIRPAVALKAE